jgi:hypothetical protein
MTAPALLDVGLHYGISEARYHADPCVEPSLSSSLVRTILNRSVGHAKLEHPRLSKVTPRDETPGMVLGSTLHALVAGDTSNLATDGSFDEYRTKPAREWRDGAIAAGKTPVLPHVFQRAERIADSLRRNAGTGLTCDPTNEGEAEVTAIWKEQPWGEAGPAIYCRARYDRLIDSGIYLDIWDWKTTDTELTHDALMRHIASQGYDIQIAHYLRGLEVLRPDFAGRSTFTLVFVEAQEPHAVQRVGLTEGWLGRARAAWRGAMQQWAHAMRHNEWPVSSPVTLMMEPPTWHAMRLEGRAA